MQGLHSVDNIFIVSNGCAIVYMSIIERFIVTTAKVRKLAIITAPIFSWAILTWRLTKRNDVLSIRFNFGGCDRIKLEQVDMPVRIVFVDGDDTEPINFSTFGNAPHSVNMKLSNVLRFRFQCSFTSPLSKSPVIHGFNVD